VRRQAACAALLGAGIHPAAPVKRRGNRRYYQHHEVLLVRRIRELLYQEGFTISGARNRLDDGPAGDAASASASRRMRTVGHLRAELASIIEFLTRLPEFPAVSFVIIRAVGAWRSLVAHLHGVQGVASSNPAAPTIQATQKTAAARDAFGREVSAMNTAEAKSHARRMNELRQDK
jgi:DNA-binding transcriptional MerR regulator